jgi:hypothetical protein
VPKLLVDLFLLGECRLEARPDFGIARVHIAGSRRIGISRRDRRIGMDQSPHCVE